MSVNCERAVFAGGCFWCTEAVFRAVKGVKTIQPGYIGGQLEHPTYEAICTGNTGHAEAIELWFDPSEVEYSTLLAIFFATHDPYSLNRQGHDIGTQYRSAVFYCSEEQKQQLASAIDHLNAQGLGTVVTEQVDASQHTFWPAEREHLDYYANHPWQPYCMAVIRPKIEKLMISFPAYLQAIEQ